MLIEIHVDEFGRSTNLIRPRKGGAYGKNLAVGQAIEALDASGHHVAAKITNIGTHVFPSSLGARDYIIVDATTIMSPRSR